LVRPGSGIKISVAQIGAAAFYIAGAGIGGQYAAIDSALDDADGAPMGCLFFAASGAGAAYLTGSQIFSMETRASAVAFFYSVGTGRHGLRQSRASARRKNARFAGRSANRRTK
jgi:hypothetical protein